MKLMKSAQQIALLPTQVEMLQLSQALTVEVGLCRRIIAGIELYNGTEDSYKAFAVLRQLQEQSKPKSEPEKAADPDKPEPAPAAASENPAPEPEKVE